MLNDVDLGVAYEDPDFMKEELFAFVNFQNKGDSLALLKGKVSDP